MAKLNRENIEDILALTPMQKGMLFHYLKDLESGLYFEQLCLEIAGETEIVVKFFEKAWNFVIHTNEMLRTVFRWEKVDHPIQVVLKERILQPVYYGMTDKNFCDKESVEEIKVKDRKEKFNLQEVPFRVTLCRLDKMEYVMIVSHHHILYDGWSNSIILEEFFHAYEAFSSLKKPVNPMKTGYKEFVRRLQTQTLEPGKTKDNQEEYWREYLKDFGKQSGVPTVPVRKKNIKEVGHYRTGLGETRKKKVEVFVREHRITLAALLYSAWGMVLQKYNETRDMVFAVTLSGRSAKIKGIEKVVGMFGSTLPLRVKTGPDQSIMNLLGAINDHMLRVEEYENNSLEVVNECLEEAQKNEIFDSLVVVENYPVKLGTGQKKGLLTVRSFSNWGMTPYDLAILITPFTNSDIEMVFSFIRGLLTEAAVKQLSRHFTAVIDEILDHPQKKIGDIEAIPAKEKDAFIRNLSSGQRDLVEAAKTAAGDSKLCPPGNVLEEKLQRIWSKVLRVDRDAVGIETNFFDFGGHSLKAAVLAAAIHKEMNVKVPLVQLFKTPTIKGLAGYIKNLARDRFLPIEPVEKREFYPVSSAQKRLYILQQMEPGSTFYNVSAAVTLKGPLREEPLEVAFRKLIHRHESLRTSFFQVGGEPVQKIHDKVDFKMEYYSAEPEAQSAQHKEERCTPGAVPCASHIKNVVRPFDLGRTPLVRVGLIKTGNKEHILMVDMHHIITDGTSMDIFVRELMGFYRGEPLPPPVVQFKDFARWQNLRLRSGELKKQQQYWTNHFSGKLPVLKMPLDFERSGIQDFSGDIVHVRVEDELYGKLKALMSGTDTTLYMVFLAVLNILLNKYSGQHDIIIGSAIAGRIHADLGNTIGLFVETLATRNYPTGSKTFSEFLEEVKQRTFNAYENQEYPFRELIKEILEISDLSRNPLFDVMLTVQNHDRTEFKIDELEVVPYRLDSGYSKVDITLEVFETDRDVMIEVEYCTGIFKRRTMERFAGHFVTLLEGVVKDPGGRISDLEMLTEEERLRLPDPEQEEVDQAGSLMLNADFDF